MASTPTMPADAQPACSPFREFRHRCDKVLGGLSDVGPAQLRPVHRDCALAKDCGVAGSKR
jgi:hypothetical protein